MKSYTYEGVRYAEPRGADCIVREFEGDGSQVGVGTALDPRRDLFNHSPDGFEWGYGGSGPAQLALAIVAHHLAANPAEIEVVRGNGIEFAPVWDGSNAQTPAERTAVRVHQQFKFALVTHLPRDEGWTLTSAQVSETLRGLRPTPMTRAQSLSGPGDLPRMTGPERGRLTDRGRAAADWYAEQVLDRLDPTKAQTQVVGNVRVTEKPLRRGFDDVAPFAGGSRTAIAIHQGMRAEQLGVPDAVVRAGRGGQQPAAGVFLDKLDDGRTRMRAAVGEVVVGVDLGSSDGSGTVVAEVEGGRVRVIRDDGGPR